MPYLIHPRGEAMEPGYTLVADDYEPQPGEVVLQVPPETGEVWDAAAGALRPRTEAEELERGKVEKVDNFARLAVDDLRPYVTGEHGDREMLFIVAKHVKALYDAQGIPADPRLAALIETGEKAMSKLGEIEAAGSAEELEAVEWEEPS